MKNTCYVLALAVLLLIGGGSSVSPQGQSQYPIADKVAAKVIEKYQTSSCQQLAAMRVDSLGSVSGNLNSEEKP